MKLISLNSKQFSISKYLIYFILMAFLLKPLFTKSYYALTFTKTTGILQYFKYTHYARRTYYYPAVDFVIKNDTFTCFGSKFQHDAVYPGDTLPVIYNPVNPGKAYVFTFLGFWSPELVYIVPFSLILSLTFLGISSIPDNFIIRL
jgi:Protein of unknown function (DUF3592)